MILLNREQTRKLEEAQVNRGATYYELMENAGVQAGKRLLSRFSVTTGNTVVILCGKGNNGGDGFVLAKYVKTQGIQPVVILVDGEPRTADAARALEGAMDNNVPVLRMWENKEEVLCKIDSAHFIVDAIYGIGFTGGLKEEIAQLADRVNDCDAVVMAVDLPSGVDCDTGNVENTAFSADLTLTFTTMKAGQVLHPAMDYCGDVETVQVGVHKALIAKSEYVMETIERHKLANTLPKQKKSANKGSVGTLLSLCGSSGMAGAAVMSNQAALKSGVGLLIAALPKSIYPVVASYLPQPIFIQTEETNQGTISKNTTYGLLEAVKKATAVLLGCGLGQGEDIEEITCTLIKQCTKPMIIDADGINALAKHIHILREKKGDIILTPHPGEMARLLHCTIDEIQKNRYHAATAFAQKYGVTLVLKGANTLVTAPNGCCFVNTTGNPGMAKGGSGDVLAGMIGAFLSQGADSVSAAKAAVYCHGVAGDIAAVTYGRLSVQPTDFIEKLPEVYKSILYT